MVYDAVNRARRLFCPRPAHEIADYSEMVYRANVYRNNLQVTHCMHLFAYNPVA